MAKFNMNTITSYYHLLGSSTKIPMLNPRYYDQWADRMEDHLNGIDEDLWKCITDGIRWQFSYKKLELQVLIQILVNKQRNI